MAEPGSDLRFFFNSKHICTLQALQYLPLLHQNFNLTKAAKNEQLKTFLFHNVCVRGMEGMGWGLLRYFNGHLNSIF